jgi:hypothetical protein
VEEAWCYFAYEFFWLVASNSGSGDDLFNPGDIVEPASNQDPRTNKIQVDGAIWVRPQGLASEGFVMHDIVLDVELGESLLNLTPPNGFEVKGIGTPVITESDVVEFMRVVAEYFDGKFPEKMPHFNHGPVEYDRFEKIEHDASVRVPLDALRTTCSFPPRIPEA